MKRLLGYLFVIFCLNLTFSINTKAFTTAEEVLNADCKKIDYPKSLADACVKGSNKLRPADDWQKFSAIQTFAAWSYSFKGDKWAYSWKNMYSNLKAAITASLNACNLERKNWTDEAALCVPFYIKEKNKKARETTDQERIDMMIEYYGKEKTVNFFNNNSHKWAWNDYQTLIENSLVAKTEPSQTQKEDQYILEKEIKIKFCSGEKVGEMTIPFSRKCITKRITYEEWNKTNKGWAQDPGPVQLCYRPEGKKAGNIVKEHITHTLIGKECSKNFIKVRFSRNDGVDDYFVFGGVVTTTAKKQKPENSSNDQEILEKEKRKIEEEKRKIEEEKRKIAEDKKKREEEEKKRKEANAKLYVIGSGTGFFVSSSGHAVSNEHVVGICRKVATKIDGEKVFFNILKTDKVNDIGLIKGDYKSSSFLNIKSDGAEFGEDIVAFGYPLRDKLSSSVKLSRGIVSSLSGPDDNYSQIQIDAAIQPGNSGGPVLNMEGQVVGIASSGLNKVMMLLDEDQPYIPENINFAVAAPTLLNFLKSNGVKTKTEALVINNTKELAKIGRPATIQLFCLNTKAKHEELKNKKKHNNVLLEKVIELN